MLGRGLLLFTGCFVIVYMVLPDADDSVLFDQGELLEEVPYEGYVLVTETVYLELDSDGYWYLSEPEN